MSASEIHLLAYLTWDRVVPWKVLALKDPKKKPFPFAYGSRQPILCKNARKGAVLWVVTVPRLKLGIIKDSRSRQGKEKCFTLPPMLVARLQIEAFFCEGYHCSEQVANENALGPGVAALLKHWGAVVTAQKKGSLFYGPNDATSFLDSLVLHSEKKAKSLKPVEKMSKNERNMSYAYKLQRIRHIDVVNSCVDLRETNPLGPLLKKTVFLSYVHNNNKDYAARLAFALQAKGWYPWFDSLSMPGYRTSKRSGRSISEEEHTLRIATLIREGMLHCDIFLSLRDKDYDLRLKKCKESTDKGPEGASWIRYERDLAKARKRRMGHIKLGQFDKKPNVYLGEPWLSNNESPDLAADKLSRIWNAEPS